MPHYIPCSLTVGHCTPDLSILALGAFRSQSSKWFHLFLFHWQATEKLFEGDSKNSSEKHVGRIKMTIVRSSLKYFLAESFYQNHTKTLTWPSLAISNIKGINTTIIVVAKMNPARAIFSATQVDFSLANIPPLMKDFEALVKNPLSPPPDVLDFFLAAILFSIIWWVWVESVLFICQFGKVSLKLRYIICASVVRLCGRNVYCNSSLGWYVCCQLPNYCIKHQTSNIKHY